VTLVAARDAVRKSTNWLGLHDEGPSFLHRSAVIGSFCPETAA
jgi:hypothetical protein